jgi:sulfur carrier protein
MDNSSPNNLPSNDPSSAISPSAIELQVNGEPKTCLAGTLLPDFLGQVGLNPKLVAVEYNGEILARPLWDTTALKANDRLEIVTIVGGG